MNDRTDIFWFSVAKFEITADLSEDETIVNYFNYNHTRGVKSKEEKER